MITNNLVNIYMTLPLMCPNVASALESINNVTDCHLTFIMSWYPFVRRNKKEIVLIAATLSVILHTTLYIVLLGEHDLKIREEPAASSFQNPEIRIPLYRLPYHDNRVVIDNNIGVRPEQEQQIKNSENLRPEIPEYSLHSTLSQEAVYDNNQNQRSQGQDEPSETAYRKIQHQLVNQPIVCAVQQSLEGSNEVNVEVRELLSP